MTTTQQLRTVLTGTTEIAYSDRRGDGDALLLVHAGVFSGWFSPLETEPALGDLRVVRMVRAGYTGGAMPPAPLAIADHAAHCAALLDHLGIGRAHLVGHSSSCAILLQLALDRPELVRSLVLSEPPLVDALAAPDDLPFLREAVGRAIGGAVAAAAAGDLASAYDGFMGAVCGPEHRSVLAAALGADGPARAERESACFFADEAMAVAGWPFDAALAARIGQPVLLVQGGASAPPVHRLVARMAGLLPDARVATVAGDDHLLPLRSPDALARAIARFVAQVG